MLNTFILLYLFIQAKSIISPFRQLEDSSDQIIILHLNDTFVKGLSDINAEAPIYSTIRTRTLEPIWKISWPAVVIYITLVIMWIRFIWTYFKRTFSVMFLIILAPLVVGRYAIEGASGRGSKTVTNWIQKFSTSVFIQSIHAMSYVIFVGPVIVYALDNLGAFIIALFFLNFMLN